MKLRTTFTEDEKENLKKGDKIFAKYIDAIDALFLREGKEITREVEPDIFVALVNSIVGQQISTKAAATVWQRFVQKVQEKAVKEKCKNEKKVKICAENVLHLSEAEIQACGMTFKKAQNILDLAQRVHDKTFDVHALITQSDEEVIRSLCALKGVGKWTAEMLMLFSMQRPNILSMGDLGIQKGLCIVYKKEKLTKEDCKYYKEKLSPYGSIASLYLWAVAGVDSALLEEYLKA